MKGGAHDDDVDANGVSPKRRLPSTHRIIVVVERGGREEGDGTMSDRGCHREGEEEARRWDDAWKTSSIMKGGTHDDGVDANGVSPERRPIQHVRLSSSWRGEGGRKEEGGREWDDAQSDRLFFMLVNRNKKKRGGKRGTLKGGTHDNGEEGKGGCGCQRHIPPTTTYSTRRIIIIMERGRSEEGEGTTRSPTDFFSCL